MTVFIWWEKFKTETFFFTHSQQKIWHLWSPTKHVSRQWNLNKVNEKSLVQKHSGYNLLLTVTIFYVSGSEDTFGATKKGKEYPVTASPETQTQSTPLSETSDGAANTKGKGSEHKMCCVSKWLVLFGYFQQDFVLCFRPDIDLTDCCFLLQTLLLCWGCISLDLQYLPWWMNKNSSNYHHELWTRKMDHISKIKSCVSINVCKLQLKESW